MNRSRAGLVAAGFVLACAAGYAAGCSASNDGSSLNEGGSGATTTTPVGGGGSTSVGGNTSTAGSGGFDPNTGGEGGQGGVIIDPCASECGDEELCDGIHAGIDDDCDYQVDENCPCSTGMAQSCFKGEPAYRDEDGCFPGTQHCSEFGFWSECVGGVHATPEDNCYQAQTGCHAITGYPFVPVNLKDGTGDFSQDAITESWTVDCPVGISPCPAVTGANPADDFTALQSGEYTVHYFKTTANGDDSCDYPLLIGAPGLRVELQWEHGVEGDADMGVDLDLHVHKPQDYVPWEADGGSAVDCAWNNCTATDFLFPGPGVPDWFNGVAPPDPVDWFLDPVPEKNTCYYGPAGSGADWQLIGQGCHNPRLDLDNISCDPTEQDVNDSNFCAPENINIDYPPANEWIRVGVHYYSNHSKTYNVHPTVRIFCHGKLAAELGSQGFYDPNQPVTFTPTMGSGSDDRTFWMVADVKFIDDPCVDDLCTVVPIYYDPNDLSPLLTTVGLAKTSVGPSYPP